MKWIVVHCSASPHGRGDDAETIHRWHRERGFDGIGYHWVILESGRVQPGRPPFWKGAHVRGYNKDSLGICLIGRGEDEFTHAQMKALTALLTDLHADYPEAAIVGHRDLNPDKECPGFDVRDLVDDMLGA